MCDKGAWLALFLGTLLLSFPVIAETQTYNLPDGSTMIVDVPPGMTYTKKQAVRSWQVIQKLKKAEEQTAKQGTPRTFSTSREIAALKANTQQQTDGAPKKKRTSATIVVPVGSGGVDKNGTFYNEVGSGYINSETRHFVPKILR